ncbi:MAG: hypothetical protein R3F11_10070 [Verrucomicrobiales bacterium]
MPEERQKFIENRSVVVLGEFCLEPNSGLVDCLGLLGRCDFEDELADGRLAEVGVRFGFCISEKREATSESEAGHC